MKQKIILGKSLLLLGLVFFLEINTNAQDITKYVELVSIDDMANDKDLQQLSAYFNDITLVGMGESTHGTHEFFTLRHRMFKYLVENHQFNTFFLEADYANCLRVNAYIHGKDDNVIEVVKEIGMWPWQTHEMVDLINWMRIYNVENPNNQLNFIGIDMQRYVENISQMDKILASYNLPITDSAIYQRLVATSFFSVTKTEDLEIYKSVWEEKKAIDISSLTEEDKRLYSILLRHSTQALSEKYKWDKKYDTRDRRMAQNIIFHLNQNTERKGFYWAHNGHLCYYVSKEGKKKEYATAGGHLKQELDKRYFIIGQDFDEGTFNAYFLDTNSKNIIEGNSYTLGPVTVPPSPDGSFVRNYGHLKSPVFIDCSYLPKKENVGISNIGAVYYTTKNGGPTLISRKNYHGKNAFDAIILIQRSTATQLLVRTISNNDK